MSAEDQPAREISADRVHIGGCVLLRRNARQERHVEIFLPADQCGVRAAKNDAGGVVVRIKGDGGELFLALFARFFGKVAGLHSPKARAGGKRGQQAPVFRRVAHVAEQRFKAFRAQKIPDFRRVGLLKDRVQMQIDELGQHKAVGLGKRPLRDRPHFLFNVFDDSGHRRSTS